MLEAGAMGNPTTGLRLRFPISSVAAGVLLAVGVALPGCSSSRTLPPDAEGVAVYQTPWGAEGVSGMPSGCRLLAESRPTMLSEADLAAHDPFREARADAAQRGGNVLLLVEKLVAPRQDFDCAAAQPISDCPATLGAWYEVRVRTYDCDARAQSTLTAIRASARASS
jgi:hypothetical protein